MPPSPQPTPAAAAVRYWLLLTRPRLLIRSAWTDAWFLTQLRCRLAFRLSSAPPEGEVFLCFGTFPDIPCGFHCPVISWVSMPSFCAFVRLESPFVESLLLCGGFCMPLGGCPCRFHLAASLVCRMLLRRRLLRLVHRLGRSCWFWRSLAATGHKSLLCLGFV